MEEIYHITLNIMTTQLSVEYTTNGSKIMTMLKLVDLDSICKDSDILSITTHDVESGVSALRNYAIILLSENIREFAKHRTGYNIKTVN